jgi:hypothetical protein
MKLFKLKQYIYFKLRNLVDRYYYGYNPKELDIPWITYKAKKYLDYYLSKKMKVFEWGSGGSTLYFARRVKKVVSIEHDAEWFKKTKRMLELKKCRNCQLGLYKPEKTKSNFHNVVYRSTDKNYRLMSFEKYCKAIDKFPDKYFDLVLIDGRARPSCIHHAVRKLQDGGIIVLDNSERDIYIPGIKFLLCCGFIENKYDGRGPINSYEWRTSVFSKNIN